MGGAYQKSFEIISQQGLLSPGGFSRERFFRDPSRIFFFGFVRVRLSRGVFGLPGINRKIVISKPFVSPSNRRYETNA